MKYISLSKLFRDVGLKTYYPLVKRIIDENESLNFDRVKIINKNAIVLKLEDGKEKDEIYRFLNIYMETGDLSLNSKEKINNYIKNDKINLSNIMELDSYCDKERRNDMVDVIERYKYRSNSYKIYDVEKFVLDVKIKNISPYSKINGIEFPAGTINTWFKEGNYKRILFSFFSKEDNKYRLLEYNKDEIFNFLNDLEKEITVDDLDEKVKDVYIKFLKDFREYYIENKDNEKLINPIAKFIIENPIVWQEFWNDNINMISEIIKNDKKLANSIIDKIYNK